MRYFWNVVTDYYKTKNDKAIVEKTFEEAFAMANDQAATGHFAGKKCTAIFVMDFKADKTKKIIDDFLKKFKNDDQFVIQLKEAISKEKDPLIRQGFIERYAKYNNIKMESIKC
jgi:hypothetical protein